MGVWGGGRGKKIFRNINPGHDFPEKKLGQVISIVRFLLYAMKRKARVADQTKSKSENNFRTHKTKGSSLRSDRKT